MKHQTPSPAVTPTPSPAAGSPGTSSAAITRRAFVRGGGLAAAGLAVGARLRGDDLPGKPAGGQGDETPPIPRAVLGRTGLEVSILGLGTALLGHQNNNQPEVPKLISVFSEAIERGINYIDTARIYGRAEEALKKSLAGRRDKVILVSKVWANTAEEVQKSLDESLRTLGVDSVDILHLHSAGDKDMDRVLGPGGALEALEKAKAAGKTRFLGMTGHSRPANFLRMIETGKVDVLMVAMNFVDRHIYGFEEKVLPAAVKGKIGVMAMKVYGGVKGGFQSYGAPRPLPSQLPQEHHLRSIAYARTLEGVTGLVIGAHSSEQLRENIRRVVAAKPLSREEFLKLCEEGKAIASGWTPRFGPVA